MIEDLHLDQKPFGPPILKPDLEPTPNSFYQPLDPTDHPKVEPFSEIYIYAVTGTSHLQTIWVLGN